MGDGTTLGDEWRRLFGKEHDFNILVHIPVHAGLKAVLSRYSKDPKRLNATNSTVKNMRGVMGQTICSGLGLCRAKRL